MNQGVIISGTGHAGLILWVLLGGFFAAPENLPDVAVTEVSLLSSAEFDALVAAVPATPAPAEPAVSTPDPAPPEVVMPEPEPAPEPAPTPEPAPPPDPVAPPAAIEQPIPVPPSVVQPLPRPTLRVAPLPADAPPPEAVVAPEASPAVVPNPAAEAPVVAQEQPAAAPEAATTEIVTEATDTQSDAPQLAPTRSVRPKLRPKPAIAVAEPATKPVNDRAATDAAVVAALAEAVAGDATPQPATTAPAGPPMTAGEKDALRIAVQACWNVGALSSEALRVTVTVAVTVAQSGVPDAGSVRMIGFEGGSEGAARQAYEAARRAILRCGATGFSLPPEKYDQWREMEIVFNPEKMRIK